MMVVNNVFFKINPPDLDHMHLCQNVKRTVEILDLFDNLDLDVYGMDMVHPIAVVSEKTVLLVQEHFPILLLVKDIVVVRLALLTILFMGIKLCLC